MNLRKRLLINGNQVALGSDRVELGLNRIGEGVFDILEPIPASARTPLAEFYLGVGEQDEYLVMTGAVMAKEPKGEGRFRITVRELSAVLDMPVRIDMRQVSARQVLGRIEKKTGLRFLLPAKARYLDERRIRFVSHGSGVEALALIAERWELSNVVWFQLPDGRMYWGHWTQGPYTASEVPIDPKLVLRQDDEQGTLELPCIPALRPGILVRTDFRFRIDHVIFIGDKVQLAFTRV